MKSFKEYLFEKIQSLGNSGWNRRRHRVTNDKGDHLGDLIDNENGTWTTTRKRNGLVVRKKHSNKDNAIAHLNTSVSEGTTDYEAHDDFGSPKKKVLARKSPSSSGGGGDGGSGNGGT
jgi:hypothetical protein